MHKQLELLQKGGTEGVRLPSVEMRPHLDDKDINILKETYKKHTDSHASTSSNAVFFSITVQLEAMPLKHSTFVKPER